MRLLLSTLSCLRFCSAANVPRALKVFGGAAIDIGLWTYGYNIMSNLGNRITLHSSSRGFSMELGAALTAVFTTHLALPISTTGVSQVQPWPSDS